MYRVIIAEDEFIVRYGIRSMIDWERIGLQLAGEASNGKEALDLMRAGPPDILITDIKMPLMDGIELIAEARRISPQAKIIIISNLEDFQYAKEAIRHGVSDYLVKSDMMPRDFEQTLLNVKKTLDADRKAHAAQDAETPQPQRRERLFAELIEGVTDEDEAARQAESLGMGTLRTGYVLHISLNASEQSFAKKQMAVRQTLDSIWPQERHEQHGCEAFSDKQGDLNLFCLENDRDRRKPADEPPEALIAQSEAFVRLLAERFQLTATVGISGPVREWRAVRDAYGQALWAARQRMFLGSGRVISFGSGDGRPAEKPADPVRIAANRLQAMVYAFQSRELAAYLEELFGHLARRRDPDLVQIVSLELLMMLTTMWPDVSNEERQIVELKKQYYEQLSRLETLDESKRWFIESFEALAQHIARMYNSDRNSVMKAAQYIQQYYRQEISLQSISDYVHLSKNYFANLFKKEIGESFLEYLTRTRIEKAKELLGRDLRATDVGSLVGIQDPKYFSKVFKKIAGVSPTEYRHLVRENKSLEHADPASAYPKFE